MIVNIFKSWKINVSLTFLLLLVGLAFVGDLRAQIKKEDVNFEYIATVTAEKGYNCCLWNMAEKYYGNPFLWTCIRDMNKIPNERKISIGTVIYIPAKGLCGVKEPEKPAAEKPAAVDVEKLKADLAKAMDDLNKCMGALKKCEDEKAGLFKLLEECRAKAEAKGEGAGAEELGKLRDKLERCEGEREKLARVLEESKRGPGDMEECEDKIRKLDRAVRDKDDTIDELESQVRKMKRMAQEQEEALREAEGCRDRIRELETKLVDCRRALEERGPVGKVEEKKPCMEKPCHEKPEKPCMPIKKATEESANPRSLIAAVAIALVGSIVWIAASD